MNQITPTAKTNVQNRNFKRILPKNHSFKKKPGNEEDLTKVIISPVLSTTVEQKKGQTAQW
jgi:hypothetical protein